MRSGTAQLRHAQHQQQQSSHLYKLEGRGRREPVSDAVNGGDDEEDLLWMMKVRGSRLPACLPASIHSPSPTTDVEPVAGSPILFA